MANSELSAEQYLQALDGGEHTDALAKQSHDNQGDYKPPETAAEEHARIGRYSRDHPMLIVEQTEDV